MALEINYTPSKTREEKMRMYRRAWVERNKEKAKEVAARAWAKYYKKNKERLSAENLARYYVNHEKNKARSRRYKKDSPEANAIRQRLYKARAKQATPTWLTAEHKSTILSFYKEAARITALTGIQFHVDHIVPLNGKRVSGLHVPWNLQVLPFYENISKSNSWH